MIGRDEHEEEVSFKVADRRKFNADGSLKDGVTIEPSVEMKPEPAIASQPVAKTQQTTANAEMPITEPVNSADQASAETDADIPGADDPTSFVNFFSTIATNAAAALGAVPHPQTGQRMLDLDTGKYWLDVIAMLKEKTAGNLHPQESKMLDQFLGEMRMHYVQLVRATEEKLKAQAAQKFSGSDILGKK